MRLHGLSLYVNRRAKIGVHAKFAEAGNQDIISSFQRGLDDLDEAFRDLNGLALGKAQFSLKPSYDVVFRQGHEGGSILVEMEFEGGIRISSQKFLFLSRGWCGLTFSPLGNKANLGIRKAEAGQTYLPDRFSYEDR
jgi:hypothetical protein